MSIEVDSTIAYHIIRHWLIDFVYAGIDEPDATLEGQTSYLLNQLREGVDPRAIVRDVKSDGTLL